MDSDGNVDNNQYYDMEMFSATDGSVTVDVDVGSVSRNVVLVVAAVPEFFTGQQTYGYQVKIEWFGSKIFK